MQRQLTKKRLSEDEEIKAAGLDLDFDEIAKKGSMSKEESMIAKWYGIYGSRQPGNLMARIVVPGGIITTAEARQIADTAAHYAQGRLNITTRQSLQYHWLKVGGLPDMLRDLAKEGVSTKHGCGDVTRNVAACPMAENCSHRRLNVRPFARRSAKALSDSSDLDNLPRKFKVTWSGCEAGCAQPYMNCVGVIAVTCQIDGMEQTGFRVVIGGGMGWKGFVAQPLFSFVPQDRIIEVVRGVALLFRDHGDRFNRSKSRLKFVVHNYGIDRCREIVLQNLTDEGVVTEGLLAEPQPDVGPAVPDRPLVDSRVSTSDKLAIVRMRVPKGELTHQQLRRTAELSEMYADQRIYTTNRQNMELHGIDPAKRDEVIAAVHEMGFATDGISGLADIVPCVGTTYCPKAVATTRNLYDELMPLVTSERYKSIAEAATINVTGCPNSCSPYRISDIGFRGMRIREELGSVEGYEMLIGGDEKAHGQKLGEFKDRDCPEVVATVLDTFLLLREGDETLTDCVTRVGMDPWMKAVYGEV
ncbi:MAG: nitrite/sulfite reductase [Lentisphaerae bacterium]|nr:nitrite/sulfite reductase [Lentisphaerota bacterium]